MKRFIILSSVITLFVFCSCSKKAADVIVGHWELIQVSDNYGYSGLQENTIWEFDADGTLRYETNGEVYEGVYAVNGPNIRLSSGYSGKIMRLDDHKMRWVIGDDHRISVEFERTYRSVSDNGGENHDFYINATINPDDAGYVRGAGYYQGSEYCTLIAVANPNYVFTYWTEYGEVVSYDDHYTFVVTRDRYLVANFEWHTDTPVTYYIHAEPDPYDGGVVYGADTDYEQNSRCNLVAVANPNYVFTCWTEYGEIVSIEENYSFVVTRDRRLVAHFERVYEMYYIEASSSPSEGGYVTGDGYYDEYSYCTLTAVANPGYVFTRWTEYGETVSTDDCYSFTVTGNRELQANFEPTYIPGEGARISVTGDCWFVLDHQYSDGEKIRLENATFGLYGAATDGGHQQLISGGEEGTGDRLRIGQAGLIWTDYSYVYFNMEDRIPIDEYGYGHATSLSDGYILNNAEVVFSPSRIYINGNLIASYSTRHLDLNTNMCLFANNESGQDVVRNQTATLGTITIKNTYGDITAKYIPTLDESGTPCFYNSVSGRYIYHSGGGTPIFTRGANGY